MTMNNNTSSNNVTLLGKGVGQFVKFFIPKGEGLTTMARLFKRMKVSSSYEDLHGWVVEGPPPEGGEWVWVSGGGDGEEIMYKITL